MRFDSKKEITNLEDIDLGTYGAVYKKGDSAIKLYHNTICCYRNPCLKFKKKKFWLLRRRNQLIKYTHLIDDVVFVKDKFVGVTYPFIEGNILDDFIGKKFSIKKEICYQLIRNAKELTDYHIYPLDYKLNNILYDQDGNVQIIDLDDIWTKVTTVNHPTYLYRSLYSLRRAIINFSENSQVYNYFDYFSDQIGLDIHQYGVEFKNKKLLSYQLLREYVHLKYQKFCPVFVDCTNFEHISDIRFEVLVRLQEYASAKIILVFGDEIAKDQNFCKEMVTLYKSHFVDIYDLLVVKKENVLKNIENYIHTKHIGNSLLFRIEDLSIEENFSVDPYINFLTQDKDQGKILMKT